MSYDGHDRQVRWNFPSPTSAGAVSATDYEEYAYDASGNRTSLRKRDGSVLSYQYDALNRMTVKIALALTSIGHKVKRRPSDYPHFPTHRHATLSPRDAALGSD